VRSLQSRLRGLLGLVGGLVARLLFATLRIEVSVDPGLDPNDPRPWVLVFWHGNQLPLLAWRRRRPTAVLVSLSKDGQIQAGALRALGLDIERGSSSHGGPSGLLAIVRRLGRGHDAAFAVDGPRGPRFHVEPGAQVAAERSHGVIVPLGASVEKRKVLDRTWCQYEIPYPFSRVAIHLGRPIDAKNASAPEVKEQIVLACARADEAVSASRSA
jgi:lysophospholipid acyltransferase (LPLAT)-like uncharacterized protein